MRTAAKNAAPERRLLIIRGLVQGVGFRPFVYNLAQRFYLAGSVRNNSAGVEIELEGPRENIAGFLQALQHESPTLSRLDQIIETSLPPRGEHGFVIAASAPALERNVPVTPDAAICNACLAELFSPRDRRYHYPFINCTNCGPRFTIVQDVPYDRALTTMAAFQMCAACRNEYDDPRHRRFHAQPNACGECGPQVTFCHAHGQTLRGEQALVVAAQQLAAGSIVAIKSLGGYHLACDALNEDAVARLRRRKHREEKPFALMAPDLATARKLCDLSEPEARALQSPQSPIVLLRRRPDAAIAESVAPNYRTLGVMLPCTPLHHLLLRHFANLMGADRPAALVMTSGNQSDEPIAYKDEDAWARLKDIADAMLAHDRAIHIRCDDSIVQYSTAGRQILRRARGYAPEPLPLRARVPMPILACGGHLKNTFCFAKGEQAIISPHLGDLDDLENLTSFRDGIAHFQRLFDIKPRAVAFDLHPDYLATKFAHDLEAEYKIGVQHHHAHIASVMAEHAIDEPVIGVALDGTGYGTDGAVWGGEIFTADLRDFQRKAHLAYMPMPGGEKAILEPWRMAAVYLQQTFGNEFLNLHIPFVRQLDKAKWRLLAQMIARGMNCPSTSSLGRLFDAVAALTGIRSGVTYEGQAAIELEMKAGVSQTAYSFDLSKNDPAIIDVRPMIREIVRDLQNAVGVEEIAGRFHNTIASLVVAACKHVCEESGINKVALSGGVLQNRLLLEKLLPPLQALGLRAYLNHKVPPNDGGLSFGQLAIAAARLVREERRA